MKVPMPEPVASSRSLLEGSELRALFLSLTCVLAGFGVLMVHSASITSYPTEFEQIYLARHLRFLAIGVIGATIAALMPARFWYRQAWWLLAVTVVLLIVVLIPGVGREVNGARSWIRIGSFTMQPSELAKITLPLVLVRMLRERRESLQRWIGGTVPFALPIALVAGLVIAEPDLGTTMLLFGSAGLALFFGGWPLRNFFIGIVSCAAGAGWLMTTRTYRIRRLTDFVSIWSDFEHSEAWQVKQSLIAMGSGGLSGTGIGRGVQKMSFLPESNTDFVFAVAGEELGLLGTLGLIALWWGILWTGLRLFRHFRRDCFATVAAMTLLTAMIGQAFLNAAVVTSLIPTTGITHPLVSYGGSSLVVSVVSLGVIISLSRADRDQDAVVLE